MTTVTVCVGSSCHIKGAREVIERFNRLLEERSLQDQVELKGSFCMERCGEGINWQIDRQPVTSGTVEDAVDVFLRQVVAPLEGKEQAR
ncbi:MAG: (2Fe-2S) ferredoxin domain-containing protein [Spirochaetota bacterium]